MKYLAPKRSKLKLKVQACNFLAGAWKAVDGRMTSALHFFNVFGTTIGEFSFGQRPDAFIGVEVRGVGGEMLDFETRVSSAKFLERSPLMGGGVVQQNDDRTTQIPQQLTQEHTNFLLSDVLVKQKIVEAQVASLGTDRNSGDHRDFIPPSLAMPMDRGFPSRSPGSRHGRH